MKKNSVSAITVLYNSERVIPQLIDSLRTQTRPPDEIFAVDNVSSDGGARVFKKRCPKGQLITSPGNLGFGFANNLAISIAKGAYILVVNPDVRLDPDFLKILVREMDEHPEAGSACGKLLRSQGVLDSAGQVIQRNRQAFNRGGGEADGPPYDEPASVFGVAGAAALYRMEALLSVSKYGGIFDPGFFLYYEDTDLSWRLRLAGWDCRYHPGAVGWHDAGKPLSQAIQLHVRVNRYRLMIKNDSLSDVIRDLWPILRFEIVHLKNACFQERWALAVYPKVLARLGRAWRARRDMRPTKPRSVREWFVQVKQY